VYLRLLKLDGSIRHALLYLLRDLSSELEILCIDEEIDVRYQDALRSVDDDN